MKRTPPSDSNEARSVSDASGLIELERALCERVRKEELDHSQHDRGSDSLWDHLERVAILAERLGAREGLDPVTCRLAGLFHDAGKFAGGGYHKGDQPEEERSIEALTDLAASYSIAPDLVAEVSDAIRQLYREDPDPTTLTRVLFDADNLDKLGPLGIANHFIKAGLRGGGVSPNLLYRLTVEMTYARHAAGCMVTRTGRQMARSRAAYSIRFLGDFLEALREDGLYSFSVEEVAFDDLILDVVAPTSCDCGGALTRKIWEIPGIKCSEIHLEHSCADCGTKHEIRFCRPRLIA